MLNMAAFDELVEKQTRAMSSVVLGRYDSDCYRQTMFRTSRVERFLNNIVLLNAKQALQSTRRKVL